LPLEQDDHQNREKIVFDVLPLGAKIIRFEEFSVTMVIRSALKPESLSLTQREELQV